jgi:hypothetical protein
MRFQFLTTASIKITAFWDIAPCNLVEVVNRSDDGGSTLLSKVGLLQGDYTAVCPKRL